MQNITNTKQVSPRCCCVRMLLWKPAECAWHDNPFSVTKFKHVVIET